MKVKPSLPSGTRDFLPQEVAKRNYIFGVIKSVFEKYGFQQIETPVLENLTTLTGKYGEEGDQLLFKVLNSGDFLKDANPETLQNKDSKKLIPQIADRGLRYDLTVPLARYVVQHQGDLVFPFKRYHLAPVWRADRPQKGRYREFYQCDADVIGSNSLINEIELTYILSEVFKILNIDVTIKINDRVILDFISQIIYSNLSKNNNLKELDSSQFSQYFLVTLDKLDKIGVEGVKGEFLSKGFTLESFNFLWELIMQANQISSLTEKLSFVKQAIDGLVDLDHQSLFLGLYLSIDSLFQKIESIGNVNFDFTLARGLNYYDRTIWEVVSNDIKIGSIAAGGRYHNLTEMFGGINMSGVGISFGIERIYDVMEELNLFPTTITQGVKVLLVPREESLEDFTFSQVQKLREQGISAEIFLGNVKKQKQFTYAEQKHIAYLIEVGENEQQSGLFRLRNAVTREMENDLSIEKIIEKLR